MAVSPLAPKMFPTMPAIDGVCFATAASGGYYKGRDDLLLMQFAPQTRIAGVFSNTSMPSVAVDLCRAHLAAAKGRARGLVVNAGIANAFTGKVGVAAARAITGAVAKKFSCPHAHIFMASTGVIGQDLAPAPVLDALKDMSLHSRDWQAAARAIMTTDTFAKGVTRKVKFGKEMVQINIIAKGSGMIAPDMATMLGFIFTDAALPVPIMRALLQDMTPQSFNAITVDSDRSTSDTLLFIATGQKRMAGAPLRRADDARLRAFKKALLDAMQAMAIQIVSDGEGASKLMTIIVKGAANDAAAKRIGMAIGNSPLVKTAIAGEDANWGRIVMAIGKSGAQANRDKLAIKIGGSQVARNGRAVKNYDEAPIAQHMRGKYIDIEVHLGVGKGAARVWACDLTHEYISINADYRS